MPTETEVYILPDGQVVIADLPAELAARLKHLQLGDQTVDRSTLTVALPDSKVQPNKVDCAGDSG
jgi:hypothetical protein